MAIARGFVTQPVEFNLPVLQIPFEAAYQQMAAMQQEKDTFDAISQRLPKYLQTDSEEAQLYRQFIDRATNEITDAFVEGNTSEAMRRLKDVQRQVVKQWQPGGLANSLEQRYQAYQTSLQEIKDHTKDFTQPGYQEFFQSQLQKQLEAGMNYDAERGTFNQITTPDLFGEVNLGEQVDDYLSGWKSDKGYGIEKSADGFWYYKGTTEQVTSEELTKALQGFYQRPDIQRAVGVQAWYQQQSIPRDMRPQVLQQYKEQVRGQLNKAITDQESVIKDLRKALTTGRNVTRLQETLNSMGYDLVEDGDLGPKTRAAAEGVIAAMEEDLTAARGRVDTMVENANLSQLFETQLQQSLTNAYVPKYAFTHRDVDMIANTPKIAMMKINAQREMMDALVADFTRPAPTMVGPAGTQLGIIAGIPTQAKKAADTYNELEQTMVRRMPQAFQQVLKPSSIQYTPGQNLRLLQDISQQQGRQSDTYVRRSGQISNALSEATRGESFNPAEYRRHLAIQGINLNDQEFANHVELFSNRENRMAMAELYDQLAPAYQAKELTQDMLTSLNEKVQTNLSEAQLREMLTDRGYEEYQRTGTIFSPNDNRNNEILVRYINDNYTQLSSEIQELSSVDLIYNEELEPYRKGLEKWLKTNPSMVIDMTTMDEKTLSRLGFDKNGDVIDSEKIKGLQIGKRNINGINSVVALVDVGEDGPVAIPTHSINKQYITDYVRTGAGLTISPNDPNKIMDEGSMNMFSSIFYDQAETTGNAYDAQRIYQMQRQNATGIVGMETKNILGDNRTVYTILTTDPTGSQSYLVSVMDDPSLAEAVAQQPLSAKTRQLLEDQVLGIHINPIQQGYQSIKSGIDESKATIGRTYLEGDIRKNPWFYRRSTNNMTGMADIIGGMFLNNE